MTTLRGFFQRKIRDESGSTEVVTTLIMIPLVLWLILSLIDVSLYFQARTSVQNVARDASRQVAVWGGNDSNLKPYQGSVSTNAYNSLYNVNTGKCTVGACSQPPTVTCTPSIAPNAGTEARCTVVYHYKAINPGNPLTGFTGFMNKPITITEVARSETGFS